MFNGVFLLSLYWLTTPLSRDALLRGVVTARHQTYNGFLVGHQFVVCFR